MTTEMLLQKKSRLALYMQAEIQILQGAQEYTIKDRSLTRADLKEIRAEISLLSQEINDAENGSVRLNYIFPRKG